MQPQQTGFSCHRVSGCQVDPPAQRTDPSCVPKGICTWNGLWWFSVPTEILGYFPAGLFPVPSKPPSPLPPPCKARQQDSSLTMGEAATKRHGGAHQGPKALGTDFWGSSSLVSQWASLGAERGGVCATPRTGSSTC